MHFFRNIFRKVQGFTLVETIIATFILSLTAIVIMKSFYSINTSVNFSSIQITANNLVRAQIEQLKKYEKASDLKEIIATASQEVFVNGVDYQVVVSELSRPEGMSESLIPVSVRVLWPKIKNIPAGEVRAVVNFYNSLFMR